MPGKTLSSLHRRESRGRTGLGSGWQDILLAGVASVGAKRMQNQELARPPTLGKGEEPILQLHREEKV